MEKRNHIGGNIYTEKIEGIDIHRYGAHIFHTNSREIWAYVNRFSEFNAYKHSPIANYRGEMFSLPFNMYTFNRLWGVITPEQAVAKIEEERASAHHVVPQNLEEQAVSLVGRELYDKLIRGYTQKQWGRPCEELPSWIIRRLPFRLTYDNRYFDDAYQGIPINGYTAMVEKMLDGIEVRLNTDYLEHRTELNGIAKKIVYTGSIDSFFDYRFGALKYRSLRFEHKLLDTPNFQGNSVINYTDADTPYTRIIEHKWFTFGKDQYGKSLPKTYISREYSYEWMPGKEMYYPVIDEKNYQLYRKYRNLADRERGVIFGGRLGEYRYYDMDDVISAALDKASEVLS